MAPTSEATQKACDALLTAMRELEALENHPDLASQRTQDIFEEYHERFVDIAVAKGFLRARSRRSGSLTPTDGNESQGNEGELPEERDEQQESEVRP
jgi:hypothetical protein